MSFSNAPRFVLPGYSTQNYKHNTFDFASDFNRTDRMEKLWVDLYAPKLESELAVRPARIEQVKLAINNSSNGRNKGSTKFLMLTGPSGCGKSTLAKIACQSMGYTIIEWIHNMLDQDDINPDDKPIARFEQFLYQSIRTPSYKTACNKKVILIDDIPDLTNDPVRNRFHSILRSCIEIPSPFLIIFVISDAWMKSDSYYRNSETRLVSVRDIIPPDMFDDYRIHTIEFLPIIKTTVLKVMKSIISSESIDIEKDMLNEIVDLSHGDIRAAINTLQFYSKRPNSSNTSTNKKRKRGETTSMFETDTGPLSLFHAVGKVLYAKRDLQGTYESKPEDIINKLPVDNDLFISYLHENCITFYEHIEDCAVSLEYLGVADTLQSKQSWQDIAPRNYRCLLSMHGIMSTRKGKAGGSLRQLHKPQFFDTNFILEKRKKEDKCFSIFQNSDGQVDEENLSEVEIEDFSEDEFDDIYGDGTDLAEMMEGF